MTRADPERIDRATVWITENGQIDAITPSTAPAPSGFERVPVIDVGDDLIVPGLIDLHNHLGYNTLPLWAVTDRPEPFAHHDIWPGAKTYGPEISKPAHVLAYADPEALLAYVEVKALVGGTTSIQGSPAANKPLDGWLTRNIDDESFGTHNRNLVLASALTEDRDALGDRSAKLDGASIFVYHCAEGQHDSLVRREFDDVVTANCLKPGFVGVHCSALQPADFTTWTAKATNAHNPGALAWSPFSNLWLYGETTDIAAARKAGLRVCLGSDWSPSGTRHVLGELKVAAIWNEEAKLGLTNERHHRRRATPAHRHRSP